MRGTRIRGEKTDKNRQRGIESKTEGTRKRESGVKGSVEGTRIGSDRKEGGRQVTICESGGGREWRQGW